jgi:hypothetical protein
MLVEDHLIMAPVAHLEALQVRADMLDIVRFPNDDECQHKDRMLGIDAREAVIAAFVDEDQIVAKVRRGWHDQAAE